ncbi:MAG: AAA family ATPase [Alphaproteobacteria bacterium]|nr:AAA family ATPase [Alphaproteobacteria bacterium]
MHDILPVSLHELLAHEFQPREDVLAPFLKTQGSAMVYAYRGIGKTHFSIGCALAVATGSQFLRFRAPKPRRVLFVDGEMPGVELQERFAAAATRLPEGSEMPDPDYLRIVTPDLLRDAPIPNLATEDGRGAIELHIEGIELLVLDNISTLFRGRGRENDEDSWVEAQNWILALRRQGISTLLVHHAGKGGAQRGTSKREDVLHAVITLKRPQNYRMSEGARFECHLEKARGIFGADANPFEAWLQGDRWTIKDIEDAGDADKALVMSLREAKMSIRQIAKESGIDRNKVHRIIQANTPAEATAPP